jgi:hypothetical protein
MDTTTPENRPSLDLPPVQPNPANKEVAPVQDVVKQLGTERNTELLPASPGQGTALPPTQDDSAQSAVQVSPATNATASNTPPEPAIPQIADDVDLIEKEWVEKAKDIVQKTKDNPHVQSKELNKVKDAYLKQRFNRASLNKESA